jgi:hypothetical protein
MVHFYIGKVATKIPMKMPTAAKVVVLVLATLGDKTQIGWISRGMLRLVLFVSFHPWQPKPLPPLSLSQAFLQGFVLQL